MNSDERRRFMLFVMLATAIYFIGPSIADRLGFGPPPQAPVVKNEKDKEKDKLADLAKKDETDKKKQGDKQEAVAPAAVKKVKKQEIKLIDEDQLVLGSTDPQSGYRMQVRFRQSGAGVGTLSLSKFDAEFVDGKPKKRPLQLIQPDFRAPPSFSLTLTHDAEGVFQPSAKQTRGKKLYELIQLAENKVIAYLLIPDTLDVSALDAREVGVWGEIAHDDSLPADLIEVRALEPLDSTLDRVVWQVVPDAKGRVVRPSERLQGGTRETVGEEIVFRADLDDLGVAVMKTFRLAKEVDGLEMSLEFIGLTPKTHKIAYRLLGPHGLPIEGEWYTSVFRDMFAYQFKDGESPKPVTYSADTIAKAKDKQERLVVQTLTYAGVENQYFAVFLEPKPAPANKAQSWDAETVPKLIHDDAEQANKSDVSVEVLSKAFDVPAKGKVAHLYRIFAGPKTVEALGSFDAVDLASKRKGWQFPVIGDLAGYLSRAVIGPALYEIYKLTRSVSVSFGGKNGSYGVAIILLTVIVRLILFPVGRKAAMVSKKMQDLQPRMTELKEKYKGDQQKLMKETQALYKEAGVNPLAGCLPALVQLPIFMGLWQALNNSVPLRHASFWPLWINNLAAPDMLFKFPMKIPFLGDYFNLLPLIVVALMIVQTKLFAPPAATQEQEMQQKMMKYMMMFMGFMFYKVPSGLGIYFITSSAWAICERLLLPKVIHSTPLPPQLAEDSTKDKRGSGPSSNGAGDGDGRGGKPSGSSGGGGWLAKRLERLLEEASKQQTIRNEQIRRTDGDGDGNGDRDRDRVRNRPRTKPGKRR